jgi:SNF2 family DNA or RNA helicase
VVLFPFGSKSDQLASQIIEARGTLITCLMRRDQPQRIAIVCPTGLALQWQDEMEERFGLNFSTMGDNFDGKLATSWRSQSLIIAPLDRLKREEYREMLNKLVASIWWFAMRRTGSPPAGNFSHRSWRSQSIIN